MIGIDFETVGLEPVRGNLRLIQTANGNGPRVLDTWGSAGGDVEALLAALAGHELVAHNASFEEAWMRTYGVDLPRGMHDTMIAWMVLQQPDAAIAPFRVPKSLGHVAKAVLGEELDKEMQTSDWSLPTLSPRQWAYAAKDAEVMVPLFTELMRRIEVHGLEFVYDIERRARPFFDWMRRTGMYVDVPKLRAAMDELRVEQEEKGEWLKKNADINWGSSKQLREHFELEARHGWPKTAGSAPSTNQDAMHRLLEFEPSVATWIEWKEAEKIRSTYGKSLLDKLTPEGRVHARFKAFGTATGRFRSSSPNLQNIPKRGSEENRCAGSSGRAATTACSLKADYASIELWLAAVRCATPTCRGRFSRESTCTWGDGRGAVQRLKPGEVTKEQNSQTHHERFPGLERALKAPLRDMVNSPRCWGVVSQACGFKVF
jgi:DNA polymerase-1